jgi:hypothetical protein
LYRKEIKKGGRYSLVFSRNKDSSIKLKSTLAKLSVEEISDNITLLSYLGITHRRNAIIKDVISWFHSGVSYFDYGNSEEDSYVKIAVDGDGKKLILNMLAEMNIDVADYRVEKQDGKIKNVYTSHWVGEEKFELDFNEESYGTIKLFGLLPKIVDSLRYGQTLVVDEMDSKLHPALLKYIIDLYNDPEKNKKKAQLIFTSHDLATMNGDNFRRDGIWFTAKGVDQASNLYSLVSFKKPNGKAERKDASYDKRYIAGRYGADPYIKRIIDWSEV